jgi:hypothetical protein
MGDIVRISMGIQWDINQYKLYLHLSENGGLYLQFLAMLVGEIFDPALQPNSSKSSKVPGFHDSILILGGLQPRD